jgi:hypothetical protein
MMNVYVNVLIVQEVQEDSRDSLSLSQAET